MVARKGKRKVRRTLQAILRRLTVAPHRKIRRKCKNCGKRHSKMSHRSHGHGSYARTRGKRRRRARR